MLISGYFSMRYIEWKNSYTAQPYLPGSSIVAMRINCGCQYTRCFIELVANCRNYINKQLALRQIGIETNWHSSEVV